MGECVAVCYRLERGREEWLGVRWRQLVVEHGFTRFRYGGEN